MSFSKRNFRIGGIAVFDTALTAVAAYAIARYGRKYLPNLNPKTSVATLQVFIGLVALSIVVHVLIKQKTQLTYYLGLSKSPIAK